MRTLFLTLALVAIRIEPLGLNLEPLAQRDQTAHFGLFSGKDRNKVVKKNEICQKLSIFAINP